MEGLTNSDEDDNSFNAATLIASRNSLSSSLEKSKSLGISIDRAGSRLEEMKQRLPSLGASVRPICADRDALFVAGGHINRAVGPAAAVLKVFDAIHGLEKSLLSDPRNDLAGYLSVLKRLEEALKFLDDNCELAVQWLDDIVEYLEDNKVADAKYISNLRAPLNTLREPDRKKHIDGGLLEAALHKLEGEFLRLLMEYSTPLPMSSCCSLRDHPLIAPSPLPVIVIQKLQAIITRLTTNHKLETCISMYVQVRSSNVRASLQALDLGYLEISAAEFSDAQSMETHIAQWGKHLEFAVKHLLEAEYKLCNDVFEKMGLDLWMGCFSKIAVEAGFLAFFQFGKTVTESRKDPIKLLKLLDIFASLNKLRRDFNKLFGGSACSEIQNLTRDLIKLVIEGAADIFWEILVQVELQREVPPPANGGVPRLVSFITDYCNNLIGEDYQLILTQVLIIQRSWKHEQFQERVVMDEVLNIIRAIELNLEAWAKAYEDDVLSNFFAMNNHYQLFKNLKGTRVGDLLGDSWLLEHERYKDYHASMFMRESWGKLPGHLSREGLMLFSGGRATARDLVKKRLRAFNEAFDDMYAKQSGWVVPERDLREKTCLAIAQTIVPVFRSYMQNYGPLVQHGGSSSQKYAKYSVQTLEQMLASLFRPKQGRHTSFKERHPDDKFNNEATSNLRRTSSLC